MYISIVIQYFFFQAEDGIRDKLVTGVQTCALPISPQQTKRQPGRPGPSRPCCSSASTATCFPAHTTQTRGRRRARSEERRVGKECRYRWSTDHLEKKIKKRKIFI